MEHSFYGYFIWAGESISRVFQIEGSLPVGVASDPMMYATLATGLVIGFTLGWFANYAKNKTFFSAVVAFATEIEKILPDDSKNPMIRLIDEFLEAVLPVIKEEKKEVFPDVSNKGSN